MNLIDIMKKNEIELEWLFTLARFNDKEGLMFFEPVVDTIDDMEVTNLDPKCIIIDDAKFIYDSEMDKNIIINTVDDVISFTRIDGIQLNIDTKEISGFPFEIQQFKNKPFELSEDVSRDGYVNLENQ